MRIVEGVGNYAVLISSDIFVDKVTNINEKHYLKMVGTRVFANGEMEITFTSSLDTHLCNHA